MNERINMGILIPVILLTIIGWLLVFSSSAYLSLNQYGTPYYYIKKQTLFICIGFVAMFLTSVVNYKIYNSAPLVILVAIIALVLMALTPILGVEVNAATRWMEIAGQRFMPVDIAKIALVLVMSYTLSHFIVYKNKLVAFIIHMIYPILLIIFTYLQPDFSSMIILFGTMVAILFVGFEPVRYVLLLIGGGFAGLLSLARLAPYRMVRLVGFIEGLKDVDNAMRQIRYGILAIASGGFFGVGPGKSVFNKLWIPEPHNDMILATLGEEFGFVGIVTVLVLYFILILNIIRMVVKLKDPFSRNLTFGMGVIIFLQFVVNFGNTLGILPPTGISLPFISYGGTNIVILMAMVGILLSIHRINWRILS
ncbi:MAG TPA: FtsW/RodA/SpoVE family cell cycle protein [Clostridia bacterium]|nr:FtsW/RodA/SpoVE family cell cycle protein [Clostridia bacterium]